MMDRARQRSSSGSVLLAMLTAVTLFAIVAALFATFTHLALVSSSQPFISLQNELLVRSAEEHVRARLAFAGPGVVTFSGEAQTQVLRYANGSVAGSYCWRLEDESAKDFLTASNGMRYVSLMETASFRDYQRKTVYGIQPRAFFLNGAWRAPAAVNAPSDELHDTLAGALGPGAASDTATRYARLLDAIDSDNELTVDGEHSGQEALLPVSCCYRATRAVVPFGVYDTAESVHIGRLLRGWSGWNSDMHFYPDAARTHAGRAQVELVLRKQYGKSTREYAHQTLLQSYDPHVMNEFGIEHMWQGTVIKALLGFNVCTANDEEWLLVQDNYLTNGAMAFRCVPLFSDTFSTQFVAKAAGDLCQYGLHGWVTMGDPVTPRETQRRAEYGCVTPPSYAVATAQGQEYTGHDAYACDGFVLRRLDCTKAYRIELLTLARGQGRGAVEVFDGTAYRPATLAGGRALLFEGHPQKPSAGATNSEGYLVLAFRVPLADAETKVYGVEITASQPWSAWTSIADEAVDVTDWRLDFAHCDGTTQLLARIAPASGESSVLVKPQECLRLREQQPDGLPIPSLQGMRDVVVLPAGAGPRLAIGAVRVRPYEGVTGWQSIDVVLQRKALIAGPLAGRFVRLWPDETATQVYAGGVAALTVPLRVATNTADTITLTTPRLSFEARMCVEQARAIECIGLSPALKGYLTLSDARGRLVARAQPSAWPFTAADDIACRVTESEEWKAAAYCRSEDIERLREDCAPVHNRPLRGPQELRPLLAQPRHDGSDAAALWDALERVYFEYQPLALSSAQAGGVLRAPRGTATLADNGLHDPDHQWADDEWKWFYARTALSHHSNDIYSITGNCDHCLFLDRTGVPSGTPLRAAATGTNAPRTAYEIVDAGGAAFVYAQKRGHGYLRFALAQSPVAPFQIAFRSDGGAGRAVFSVADLRTRTWLFSITNECRQGQWLSPPIAAGVHATQVLARITLLATPDAPVRFHDFASIPQPQCVNAININSATPAQLRERLDWPSAVAEAVARHAPYYSFGQLHAVPGLTDDLLNAAFNQIMLRSCRWSATIGAAQQDTHVQAIAWFAADDGAVGGGARAVDVVERRRLGLAPRR